MQDRLNKDSFYNQRCSYHIITWNHNGIKFYRKIIMFCQKTSNLLKIGNFKNCVTLAIPEFNRTSEIWCYSVLIKYQVIFLIKNMHIRYYFFICSGKKILKMMISLGISFFDNSVDELVRQIRIVFDLTSIPVFEVQWS